MNIKFMFFFGFIFLISCNKVENNYGFYYWQSEFNLDKTEIKTLEKSKCPKFYIRGGDIDLRNGEIQILGEISPLKLVQFKQKIVPVFFITNRVWEKNVPLEIIYQLINIKVKKMQVETKMKFTEIQIDSDWTPKTQKRYFEFLKNSVKYFKTEITCTIRLHQIKEYDKTGIPPVKKGYLMCYATSSPLENQSKNSILEINTLKNYLSDLDKYPLKLDFALPIYSWAIVTNHLGKKKLINGITEKDLKKMYFEKLSEKAYKVREDGFYFGMFLNKDFEIKLESVSENDLQRVKEFIEKKYLSPHYYIYYHLDSALLSRYPNIFGH